MITLKQFRAQFPGTDLRSLTAETALEKAKDRPPADFYLCSTGPGLTLVRVKDGHGVQLSTGGCRDRVV